MINEHLILVLVFNILSSFMPAHNLNYFKNIIKINCWLYNKIIWMPMICNKLEKAYKHLQF